MSEEQSPSNTKLQAESMLALASALRFSIIALAFLGPALIDFEWGFLDIALLVLGLTFALFAWVELSEAEGKAKQLNDSSSDV